MRPLSEDVLTFWPLERTLSNLEASSLSPYNASPAKLESPRRPAAKAAPPGGLVRSFTRIENSPYKAFLTEPIRLPVIPPEGPTIKPDPPKEKPKARPKAHSLPTFSPRYPGANITAVKRRKRDPPALGKPKKKSVTSNSTPKSSASNPTPRPIASEPSFRRSSQYAYPKLLLTPPKNTSPKLLPDILTPQSTKLPLSPLSNKLTPSLNCTKETPSPRPAPVPENPTPSPVQEEPKPKLLPEIPALEPETPSKPAIVPQLNPAHLQRTPRSDLESSMSTGRKTPRQNSALKAKDKVLPRLNGPGNSVGSASSRRDTPTIEGPDKFESPYSKVLPRTMKKSVFPSFTIKSTRKPSDFGNFQVDKLTGMDAAKPAFTIKPMINGGPTTSTPKPQVIGGNSNSVTLRKMTNHDIKMSPSERAKVEETRARIAKLEKEEEDIKAKLSQAEEQEKRKDELPPIKGAADDPTKVKDTSTRPSVKGNVMVATDPSTFARNSINMIYTPKSKPTYDPEGDDKPAFDPDVFAKTIIKSSNLSITPRKETTTTSIATTAEPAQTQPAPVEQPNSLVDSGIEIGGPNILGVEEQPVVVQEKKKEKKRKHKDRPKTKDEYERLLKCPRCKNRFEDPKIVCCQRMCAHCLQKMIDSKAKSGLLFCKVCTRAIIIPDSTKPRKSWAKQFPSDQFLVNLKEAVIQLEGKRLCYVCDSRKQVTDATMFCYECDTYFCNTCDEAHRHMPKLQNHRLTSLDDLSPVDLMKNKKRACKIHETKTLDLFCKDCEKAICVDCASSIHQKCKNISSIATVAEEKKKMLKVTEKNVKVGIAKCDEGSKRLKSDGADVAETKKQAVQQIDSAFHAVSDALNVRKKKLIKHINNHFHNDVPQFESLSKQMDKIKVAMKANNEFINELMNHASDLDVIENADRICHQADVMVQHNAEVTETPKPKVLVKMDDMAVRNFVELVSLLGAEVGSTQVKGVLVKKMTTKMSGDQAIPDIRDILVMDSGALLAVDNKNSCVKGIIFKGEHFQVKRLDLQSQPWGGTKLQDNMLAVTGLKCFYIICLSDDLTLQTVVHTRKDYWGVCALSPINLACSCKYPPCVDIVDITGRRLRTIDTDQHGNQLFDMPGYLGNVGGRIVVSDRNKKALICVDQLGEVQFTYTGEGNEELMFPRGICIDKYNRIYVADHDKGCVYLISPDGRYLCTVISATKPRTICLDSTNNTLYVSMEGKGITFFNIIEIKTT